MPELVTLATRPQDSVGRHERRRIIQNRLESELSRPDHQTIGTQSRPLNTYDFTRSSERLGSHQLIQILGSHSIKTPKKTTKNDRGRIENIDGIPQRNSKKVELPKRFRRNLGRLSTKEGSLELVAVDIGKSGESEKPVPTHLGLEASGGTTMTFDAVSRDERVTELPRIPLDTGQSPTAGNDSATDTTRTTVQVDEVSDSAPGPEKALSTCPKICIVGRENGKSRRSLQFRSERLIHPVKMRRKPNYAIPRPHKTRNSGTNSDDRMPGIELGPQLRDHLRTHPHGIRDRRAAIERPTTAMKNSSAEPDNTDRDRIDLGIDSECHRSRRRKRQRTRPTHLVAGIRIGLDHKTAFDELTDERRDRRTIESSTSGQRRSWDATRLMDETQHQRQIVATDIAVAAAVGGFGGSHRRCRRYPNRNNRVFAFDAEMQTCNIALSAKTARQCRRS